MELTRDNLPPLEGTDAMLSALLDQDPSTRRDRLLELRDSDPAKADSVSGMLAALEEFGLLAEPAATTSHPTRIGPFRILAMLGHGGMGTVYLAEQDGLQRRVALKVIHGAMAQSARMRERFRREAVAASRLEHPAICPVYEIGENEGTPWIAMRFVPGAPLGKRLEQAQANGAPLRLDEAARMVATLAEGVHQAHESGLVHRDIKPSNILLGGDDKPVLVDFGLASLDDEDGGQRLTMTGDLVGTPHYMAPEQIAGRAVDRRCDVYALGVVLYECLTLRTPFDAVNRESLFRQILRDEPEDPRRRNRLLDRDTVTVMQTALAKDPEQRYRSAAMLADDLRRLLAHQPILARRAGVLLRLRRFAQRNPLVAGFVAFLLVAVVAFAVLLQNNSRSLARAAANEQALRANEQGVLAPVRGLERAWAAVQQDENVDTTSALYHAVQRHHVAAVLPHEGAVWCARFAPQGDRILTCAEDFTARLWDRAGKQLHVMLHPQNVFWAEWSPDGSRIATACLDGRSRLFDRDGRLLQQLHHGRDERPGNAFLDTTVAHWVMRAQFSPSGRHIATSCSDGKARIWDVANGSLVHTWSGGDKRVEPLQWSPDGSMVAVAETDNDTAIDRAPYRAMVWRLHVDAEAPAFTFPMPSSINWIAFSPDDGSLLVSCRDGTARVFELQQGRETLVLAHEASVAIGSFSPDGSKILTSCADHIVRLWDLQGRVTWQLRTDGSPRASFLADGRIVCSHFGPGIVVLDHDLHASHTFRGQMDMVYPQPDLSPDGQQLVSASWDGTAMVWQLHDPALPRVPAHRSAIMGLAQLPDGRIASVGEDRALCLTDLTSGVFARHRIPPAPKAVTTTADGRRLLVVHEGSHGQADAWLFDASARQETGRFPIGGLDVAALLLPGDQLLTVAHRGGGGSQAMVRGLDGSPPRPWGQPIEARGYMLSFSPARGQVAVSGWHQRISVRDAAGAEVGWWRAHDDWVRALAFGPDGQHLASGSRDSTIRIWDLRRWSGGDAEEPPSIVLRGHEGRVHAIAWSNNARWLASAGSDGATRLWDAATGEPIAVLRGHSGVLVALLFTHDDRLLLTGGGDGVIQAWPTERDHLHRLATRARSISRPEPAATPATAAQLSMAMVRSDAATALRIGQELFDRAAIAQDAEEFNCLAWRIVSALPGLHRDLDLALRAAQEAVRLTDGKHWSALDTLAEVHFARGDVTQAIPTMKSVIALVDHETLRQKLAKYEAAAASKRK